MRGAYEIHNRIWNHSGMPHCDVREASAQTSVDPTQQWPLASASCSAMTELNHAISNPDLQREGKP
jgi:hypothetical protein